MCIRDRFSDSAVYLNLKPTRTLADLGPPSGSAMDEALFDGFVTEAGSIKLVVGADRPERAELVTLPAIQLAIDRLSAVCQYVLIDSPASLGERTLTALDTSDMVLLVTSDSLPSLNATRRYLDLFDTLGVQALRIRLILNRNAVRATECRLAAEILGRTPDFTLRWSAGMELADSSGRPLVSSNPTDPFVSDLRQVADLLIAATRGSVEQRELQDAVDDLLGAEPLNMQGHPAA